MTDVLTRRAALGRLTSIALSPLFVPMLLDAKQVDKHPGALLPGEYTWNPELSPKGPVAVIVSVPEQLVHVYRNGVRMAVSTCSTGKTGHETPTGVFTVLQKDKHHHSATYNNAPMPNMNRLTWDGVALHAGKLPGYPASHGCVRLPMDFSEKLFGITHVGTPVIIAGAHQDPKQIVHPGMVLSGYADHEFQDVLTHLEDQKHPSDWESADEHPVTTVIASTSDRKIDLIENESVITSGRLTGSSSDDPDGQYVFVLQGAHSGQQGMAWHMISHHHAEGVERLGQFDSGESVIASLKTDGEFRARMARSMHPGMVLIVTDAPMSGESRSTGGFRIMASHHEPEPASRGPWVVQVASLTDPAKAEHLADELRGRGFKVFVVPFEINGTTYRRVRVGPLPSRSEAVATAQSLQAATGYQGQVLMS
ncbi:MAG: L,D-transpeptidase family protein [Chromatiaceae bacterium]